MAVADIDLIAAQMTAQELRNLGVQAEPFLVDVGDQKSVEQLKSDVEAKLGLVDILVNNAGLLAVLSLSEGTPEDVQRIINVNLASHFWVSYSRAGTSLVTPLGSTRVCSGATGCTMC